MMTLGIDTATSACAVAVWSAAQARALAVRTELMSRGQAERLVPLIMETLADAGVDFAAIDRFAATVGPGTFTGLRIGLAAARGLALAAGRPLVGVTSFEAAVRGLPPAQRAGRTLLACIESRRDDLFLQAFSSELQPLTGPADVLPADVPAFVSGQLPKGPLLLVGDAAERTAAALDVRPLDLPVVTTTGAAEALAAARLAATLTDAEIADRPADPFYLRPPDVTLPAGKTA